MVVKNDKLGGNDFVSLYEADFEDFNDTNNAIIDRGDSGSEGVAELAYKTLQTNNVFENSDTTAADEYVIADGTNKTVDVENSSANFNTDKYELNNTNGYNVTNANYTGESGSISSSATATSMYLSPDGLKLFVCAGNYIYRYVLNAPYDLNNLTYNGRTGSLSYPTRGISLSSDGTKMFVLKSNVDAIYVYVLTVPWDVLTHDGGASASMAAGDTEPRGFFFNKEGTKIFVTGQTNDRINQYDLSIPWDVTTADYITFVSIAGETSLPDNVTLSDDGTKMFVIGGAIVYQYTLSIPWLVSSATYDTISFNPTAQETSADTLFVCNGGNTMYISGSTNNTVYKYDFGTEVYSLSSTVIHKQNTLNLDGTEEGLVVYDDAIIPTNTSITIDLDVIRGDGTDNTTTGVQESDTTSSNTAKYGISITPNENLIVKSVTKFTGASGTMCSIGIIGNPDPIITVVFDGDIATFTDNIILESGINYYIDVSHNNKVTSTYIRDDYNVGSHLFTTPIAGTYFDLEGYSNDRLTSAGNYLFNVASVVTQTVATTTPITGNTLTNNNTGVVDVTLLGAGTLKITKNLATTDTSVTPNTKGYGVKIIK